VSARGLLHGLDGVDDASLLVGSRRELLSKAVGNPNP
jgi:hypothetical protein